MAVSVDRNHCGNWPGVNGQCFYTPEHNKYRQQCNKGKTEMAKQFHDSLLCNYDFFQFALHFQEIFAKMIFLTK